MILPLEKQVCSLKLAQKLMRLRSPQNSTFFWEVANFSGSKPYLRMAVEVRDSLWPRSCFDGLMSTSDCKNYYAAYTVAELGELLRMGYTKIGYPADFTSIVSILDEKKSEANYRAERLVYLLKQKFITF